MKIGLYGMPASGKTYILERIPFLRTMAGSRLLREWDPEFDSRDEAGRERVRKALCHWLREKCSGEDFILDGHYAFGEKKVFTEEDGQLYDAFLYLYLSPSVLRARMEASEKNRKYLRYDIGAWQDREIAGLRQYCHEHDKDFYVLDNPPEDVFGDISDAIGFIREVAEGYSCVSFAAKCAEEILGKSRTDTITLLDGDRTLAVEDSSRAVFDYRTRVFDGEFYTGYQVWRQNREFEGYPVPEPEEMPVRLNERVMNGIVGDAFLLTSGHERIWRFIAGELGIPFYGGREMAAETKFYITKMLQRAGKRVIAYGDSMNDYFMLRQANLGYLVRRPDGSVSGSLKGKDMEGLIYV